MQNGPSHGTRRRRDGQGVLSVDLSNFEVAGGRDGGDHGHYHEGQMGRRVCRQASGSLGSSVDEVQLCMPRRQEADRPCPQPRPSTLESDL